MFKPTSLHGSFSIGFSQVPKHDFDIYARGYFNAAKHLVSQLLEKVSFPDYDAYPVMFLYRQTLELHLKACIYNSSLLAYLNDITDLDATLVNNHELTPLVDKAKIVTDKIFPKDIELKSFMNHVKTVVNEFNKLDSHSFSFRYPVDRYGNPNFSRNTSIGLKSVDKEMTIIHEGFEAIQFGIDVNQQKWIEIYTELKKYHEEV